MNMQIIRYNTIIAHCSMREDLHSHDGFLEFGSLKNVQNLRIVSEFPQPRSSQRIGILIDDTWSICKIWGR
jgi:hypothetical protein